MASTWSITWRGASSCNDVGRYILREGGTSLQHGTAPHSHPSISYHARREDSTFVYLTVSGNLSAVTKDTVVTHLGIVRDMSSLHEHIVVAQHGLTASVGGTVYHHILAYDIIVANDEFEP